MKSDLFKLKEQIDSENYFFAKYYVECSKNLASAAWNIAIGQSVGNPSSRSVWETEELFRDHSCIIVGDMESMLDSTSGEVIIAFPVVNIDFRTDGVSHLLVNVMGGQMDIEEIKSCKLLDIEFPDCVSECFLGPKYGINGIREYTGVYDKPLLGGILKPKTGVSPGIMLEMVKEMVEGGVNFIKEDEILSSPSFCRIEDRVPLIMDYLKDKRVVYCVSIHSDPAYILERVKQVHELGGNGVHVNFWCGLGAYKNIRELDLPIFMHFQKSGDRVITNPDHNFSISWPFMCKLAGMMGVDFIHSGMIGGYYPADEEEVLKAMEESRKQGTLPALSCGFHPGLVNNINEQVGVDYLANVGGAMHGHPSGTKSGAIAMRQAIDGIVGKEFREAVGKFGNPK
jgi:ribulose 1,5-bisphosphate carboxylase large subunit-like protein